MEIQKALVPTIFRLIQLEKHIIMI